MQKRPSNWYFICTLVTLLSALVSAGFSLANLSGMPLSNPLAWYAASRSLALPAGVLIAFALGSHRAVVTMALVMALVQAFDAGIGAFLHIPAKTYGPAVFALLGFFVAYRLHRTHTASR